MGKNNRPVRSSAGNREAAAPSPLPIWIRVVFAATVSLLALGAMFPEARTWGFSHAAYLPVLLTCGLVAVLFFVIVQALRLRMVYGIDRLAVIISARPRAIRLALGTIFSLCAGVVMYLFPIRASLLGDSYLYLSELVRIVGGAPVKYFSYHSLVAPLLFFKLGSTVLAAFRISQQQELFRMLTAVLGAIYVAAMLWHIARATRNVWDALLLGALLLGCGGVVFFFGYVEFYAPLAVATLCFVISLHSATRWNGSLAPASIWFVIALLCHFSAISMLPALFWAFVVRRMKTPPAPQRLALGLGLLAILCSLMYVLHSVVGVLDLGALGLIPLHATTVQGAYTLLSPAHLLDVPNVVLLTGGIAPVLVVVLSTGIAGKVDWCAPAVQTSAVLVTFSLLLVVFFNPLLGMARDWDIYAPLGIAMASLAFAMYDSIEHPRGNRPHAAATLSVLSLVVAASWIGLNCHEESAIARYMDILRRDEGVIHADFTEYGYLNLEKFYLHRKDDVNAARMLRRAIEVRAYPWDFARFTWRLHEHSSKALLQPDIDAVAGLLLRKSTDSLFLDCGQDPGAADSTEYLADQLLRLFIEGSKTPFTDERLHEFARRNPMLPHAALITLFRDARSAADVCSYMALVEHSDRQRYRNKPLLSTFVRKLAYLRFGNFQASRQSLDSAAYWYRKYYALDSSNVQMVCNYASVSIERKDDVSAGLALQRALAVNPEYPDTRYFNALFLLEFRHDKAAAKTQLMAFLKRSSDQAMRTHAESLLRDIGD